MILKQVGQGNNLLSLFNFKMKIKHIYANDTIHMQMPPGNCLLYDKYDKKGYKVILTFSRNTIY